MVDNFSLLVSHGLMLLAAVRLLFRADLDHEPSARDDHISGMQRRKSGRDA